MRAAYTLDTADPMIATPSAPPTWRVVSLTAEPTPALARGSDPMTDSVAGAIVMPMPAAITTKNEMTTTYAVPGCDRREQAEADGDQTEAGEDDPLGADPLDQTGRQRRDEHHRRGVGQQPDAGLQRGVAVHELPVLGHQEHRAEQGEERQRDRAARGGEPGVAEHAHVEHRVRGRALPPHETTERDGRHHERDQHGCRATSPWPALR